MALKQGPQERSHGDVSSGSIGSNDVPAAIVGPSRPPRSPSTKAPFYLVCETSPGGPPLPPDRRGHGCSVRCAPEFTARRCQGREFT